MRLKVNGQSAEYPEGITVKGLLEVLGIDNRPVAVELNRSVVPRNELSKRQLREDDSLEIVTFVGGG